MKRRAFLFSVIALALACAIVACAKNGPKKPLKIAMNEWAGYACVFVAQEKGFFRKNNVAVKLLIKRDFLGAKALYRYGEADGLFSVFGDVMILHAEGVSSKVVYVVDYSETGDVIIGRKGLKSLRDLKGKTVSFEGLNTFSHIFVLKSLEEAGLKESEVKFKNIPAMDVLSALGEGKIDAGHTWQPVASQAVKKGYEVLAMAGDTPGIITDVLAFSARTVRDRPDDVRAVVKSLLEARDFIYANWDEAVGIMATKERMTKEEMAAGIKGIRMPDLRENIEAMKKSKKSMSLYTSGEAIGNFYLNRGQLSRMPNLDSLIEPRFVDELGEK